LRKSSNRRQIAGRAGQSAPQRRSPRDLKPAKLMMDRRTGAKLLDFGLRQACSPLTACPLSPPRNATKPVPPGRTQFSGHLPIHVAGNMIEATNWTAAATFFRAARVLYEMPPAAVLSPGKEPTERGLGHPGERAPPPSGAAKTDDAPPPAGGWGGGPQRIDHAMRRCLANRPERAVANRRDIAIRTEMDRTIPAQVRRRGPCWQNRASYRERFLATALVTGRSAATLHRSSYVNGRSRTPASRRTT